MDGQETNQTQVAAQAQALAVSPLSSFLRSAEESGLCVALFFSEGPPEPKVFAAEGNESKRLNTSSKQKQFAFPTKVQGSEPRK